MSLQKPAASLFLIPVSVTHSLEVPNRISGVNCIILLSDSRPTMKLKATLTLRPTLRHKLALSGDIHWFSVTSRDSNRLFEVT